MVGERSACVRMGGEGRGGGVCVCEWAAVCGMVVGGWWEVWWEVVGEVLLPGWVVPHSLSPFSRLVRSPSPWHSTSYHF